MTNKRTHDAELAQMVLDRNVIVGKIGDLKYDLLAQEEAIVVDLLRSGNTQFITVNWRKLTKAYRNW